MSELISIPPITHELGRYWTQPAPAEMLIDAECAVMSRETMLDKLSNYECSTPSGVYVGKAWRCGDVLCWYDIEPGRTDVLAIKRRKIALLIEEGGAK